jgi:hypothetical protein
MRNLDTRLVFGLLLVAAGVVYLLHNLGIITGGRLVWAAGLAIVAVVLLALFGRNRDDMWWSLIPAVTLIGFAVLLVLQHFSPETAEVWGGALVLGSIGLSFWLIYLVHRDFWWAIIPGGVMLTLAVVSAIDELPAAAPATGTGGIFFIGLGVTFALVALAPGGRGRLNWAYFPAAILAAFGLLILVGWESAIGYLWPLALILAGIYLLYRTVRRPT